MTEQLKVLLGGLRQSRIVQVLVGPAGVHYDFCGSETPGNSLFQYGILSNTSITLHSSTRQRLLEIGPYPPFSCQENLQRWLLEKRVTEAEFDEARQAARIILEDSILLSLVPTPGDDSIYWALFHWPCGCEHGLNEGFVITAKSISVVEEPLEGPPK